MESERLTPRRTIAQLLRHNAEFHGEKVAFASPGRLITYHDLESKTGRIACQLNRAGISRGHYVVVLLDRCVEAVESILAIIRADAIAVPLDPRCSQAELATILDNIGSGPWWIITSSSGAAQMRNLDVSQPMTIWTTDITPAALNTLPFEDLATCNEASSPRDSLAASDGAFLHYTSGSTGTKPKGVLSSQEAYILSALASNTSDLEICCHDRIFCPLPITHSYGFAYGVITPLCTAASVYLTGSQTLTESLANGSYTIIIGVPPTYSELLSSRIGGSSLSSVRLCFSAGAPTPPSLNKQVEQNLGTTILSIYGCTETCGPVTRSRLGEPFVEGSCGPPLPGRDFRIVHPETMRDVVNGDEGEIWIRSPSLMIQYHNDSTSAFIDGWYRSGDIGRCGGRADFIITGRLKEMIVRGGQNIHPAEIESVLNGCDGVKESVVIAARHDIFGEVPTAYVVPNGKPLILATLVATCREVLPNHKVPVDFFEIDSVPRTKLGKPRRRAVASRPNRRLTVDCLTRDAIEATILAEFCHARGLAPDTVILPTALFGDMGMNSLVGIVIRDRLMSMTGLDLPLTLLFDHTTPKTLSEYLYGRISGRDSTQVDVITSSEQPLPDTTDPIAIVSMACRYPGGIASPEDLWNVVEAGVDVTSDFPVDRGWDINALCNQPPDTLGTTTTRRGGFLHDMADFDAGLFGISPKEAEATDPQQRLLLESTWNLLERAGLAPTSLRGSNTGVYIGMMYNDYGSRFVNVAHDLEGQLGLGSAASVAAGRISHSFDFRGPSLSIDTACSSSLVAVDLAAKSLRLGECSMAIAGGVTVMATPQAFIIFSKQGGLSPDGCCRSYSDDANGTAWSEGVGLLLLERLSDARRNGHPILGLVRGSATNSDGRSSTLTSPSGPQQERLIRDALRNANLSPTDVDVIEGHGTATSLGDPIEVRALVATYGQGRTEPALLGSVKANLGHTQAAAGVAGIIKMVMAMRQGTVPASLHVRTPSRHINWSNVKIKVLTKAEVWPQKSTPRRAAVSAFGIGGTNAHVILEQGESPGDRATRPHVSDRGTVAQLCPWLLSGADEPSLRAQARAICGIVDLDPADVAFSLATTRSPLRWRAAVPPGDVDALVALAQGSPHTRLLMRLTTAPRLIMLFSGQGVQFPGMLDGLSAAFPAFKEALDSICDAFDVHLEAPLLETLRGCPKIIHRTDIAQAAIFAFQVAFFRTLEHFGVVPAYPVGHSIGEIAAAHVAGVFSLADSAKMVAARGRLMNTVSVGAMASIEASEAEVGEYLAKLKGPTETPTIAAVNSAESVVISGQESAVVAVTDAFRKHGRRTKRLRISLACHSPAMATIVPAFLEILETISYAPPKIPIVSTVTGRIVSASDQCSAGYWAGQVVAPVRFAEAVHTAKRLGGSVFLENGPSAALAMHVQDALPMGATVKTLLDALALLHVQGSHVEWSSVLEESGARRVEIPTYSFQRRRYWLEPPKQHLTYGSLGHPFLEYAAPFPGSQHIVFSGRISVNEHNWLSQHVMLQQNILPATAFAEIAVKAGTDMGLRSLDELTLLAPLNLPAGGEVRLQVVLTETESRDRRTFDIFSRPTVATASQEWVHHASGSLSSEGLRAPEWSSITGWPVHDEIDVAEAYDKLNAAGIVYGPPFQCVHRLWRTPEGFVAKLSSVGLSATTGHAVHPVLLDAAIHVPMLANPRDVAARVPFRLAGVRLWPSKEQELCSVVHVMTDDRLSVRVYDLSGRAVAEMETITLRTITSKSGGLFILQWVPTVPTASTYGDGRSDNIIRVRSRTSGLGKADAVHQAINDILAKLKSWWNTPTAQRSQRLVVVTERATSLDPDLTCAAVWGFVRSAQSEYGDSIVSIDVDATQRSEDALEAALASGETVLAIQDGRLLSPKLVQDSQQQTSEQSQRITTGTILVTGGTGALGRILSRHLVRKHGATRLLLVSRAGPCAPHMVSLQAELATYDAHITVRSCDVSNYKDLEKLIQSTHPPVTAVFHTAGVLEDALLESLSPERVSRVLRPKVDAGLNLHLLLPHARPFVLFSSAAGILGNPGQANYAAGNTFLDALARHRAHEGQHGLSLAWGPWQSENGMAGRIDEHGPLLSLSDQQGLDLLDAALLSTQRVVIPLRIKNAVPIISKSASNRATHEASKAGAWRKTLGELPASERTKELQRLIRNEIANVLGYDQLPDLPFTEIGLDSLSGVLIRNKLSILAGVTLSSSVLFDLNSVPELADVVHEKLGDLVQEDEVQKFAAVTHGHKLAAEHLEEIRPTKELRLTTLCQQLCHSAHFTETIEMLDIASLALPVFKPSEIHNHATLPRRLRTGKSTEVSIVCLPDFFPSPNNGVFRLVSSAMNDGFDIFDLAYPANVVPRDVSTLVEVLAHGIRATLPERHVVLVGYSAGGLVAHALAHELKDNLTGLVLIDTYPIARDVPNWLAALPGRRIVEAGSEFGEVYDDSALATMGHYMKLFRGRSLRRVASPSLFIRASEPSPEMDDQCWEASWSSADEVVALPGDHISLLRDHARTTAAEIGRWTRGLL